MTTLPAASEFTGSTVTEAQFKTAISNLRSYLSGLLGDDGMIATALDTLGGLGSNMVSKSAAYTVLATDKGVVFLCSGTWSLSLAAAATLGGNFSCAVINTGTGVITIDPNAAELIDGAATKTLTAGQSCIVTCNGITLYTISGAGGGFESGVRMSFQQTTAPTGWTKDVSAALNDSIMRIVTGTVSSGGSTAFSTFNGQTAVGATTLSIAQMPPHGHPFTLYYWNGNFSSPYAGDPYAGSGSGSTGNSGGGGSHAHSLTTAIKYYDFIIASKN